jgi:hypothetical protein
MKDTFEENLTASQKEEEAQQKAYEDLKAAKIAEINATQSQIDDKTDQSAKAKEQLANDKQDVENVAQSLSEDAKFLVLLKKKCRETDTEWTARQQTRMEEIAAVGKALQFLASDDAHDLFTGTFNPSLAQTGVQTSFTQLSSIKAIDASPEQTAARAKATALLDEASKKHPQLSVIASKMKLDAFTKVKKAIDDMVGAILQQKADDVKHRDYCVNSLNANDKETTKASRDRDDLQAQKEDFQAQISQKADQIKALQVRERGLSIRAVGGETVLSVKV